MKRNNQKSRWISNRLLVATMIATFALSSAMAASRWVMRTWQSDVGLPDNTVVGIEQTPDGFLWVATPSGLARFDGVQFRQFTLATASGVPPGMIQATLVDSKGRLWVALEGGTVASIDQGRTTLLAQQDGLPNRATHQMTEDRAGAVWLTYVGGGVSRIQEGKVRAFTATDGLPDSGTCQLALAQDGQLWFACGNSVGVVREDQFRTLLKFTAQRINGARAGGLWMCKGKELWKVVEGTFPVQIGVLPIPLPVINPTVLYEDRAGTLWIGTRQAGLFRFWSNPPDRTCDRLTELQEILSLKEDRDGNLWMGSRSGGLTQCKRRSADLSAPWGLLGFTGVRSLCQDTSIGVLNELWAVAQNGALLHSNGGGWAPMSVAEGWSFGDAQCVSSNPKGGVWIGTQRHGLHLLQNTQVVTSFTTTNGLAGDSVNALLMTLGGELWIGTEANDGKHATLQCYKEEQFNTFKLPPGSGPVVALVMDASNDCWAATAKGLLLRVHQDVLTDQTRATLTDAQAIRTLCATPDNSLWIGYGGQGLGRLRAGRFSHYRTEQGLHDDFISQILSDRRGRLWFAGNRGIFSVRQQAFDELSAGRSSLLLSTVYSKNDGQSSLQASHGFWPGALCDPSGKLWFAMEAGVAEVYAHEFKDNPQPPSVVLERVIANGKTVAAYSAGEYLTSPEAAAPPVELAQGTPHLRLSPGQRQVEFTFTALSFKLPESLGFKYRLHGLDKDWVEAGTRRSVTYSQLLPGDYRFQVTACNSDGVWNETGVSLALTVEPYWWETAWFRVAGPLVAAGVLLAGILLFVRSRYRRKLERMELQRAMERERARISQDLHDDLGAELASIAMLSDLAQQDVGENQTVRARLGEIISHARQTILRLEEIVWAVNPANDTIERFAIYICKFAQRYLELAGVRSRFDLPDCFPASMLGSVQRHNLFLAAKEALHNAVRHGKPAEVILRIVLESGCLRVIVEDNGVGFEETLALSATHGSSNMRSRMSQINGTFERRSAPGQGTTVSLSVPVQGEMT